MDSLTSREREIVFALAEGLSNKEIGRRLNISEGTVKVHLHNIYSKLGVKNRTALAVLAHNELASRECSLRAPWPREGIPTDPPQLVEVPASLSRGRDLGLSNQGWDVRTASQKAA
jgi:DNA-binding CsgD family transcriptional regulator